MCTHTLPHSTCSSYHSSSGDDKDTGTTVNFSLRKHAHEIYRDF